MMRQAALALIAALRRTATAWRLLRSPAVRTRGRDLHVGAGTRLWAPVAIHIGDHTYIGKQVCVESNARIGANVLIANRVALVGRRDHDFSVLGTPVRFAPWVGGRNAAADWRGQQIVVHDDVWLGYGAIVLGGVTIGRGAVVAAGAVVHRDVEPYSIVAGNPAQEVAQRFADAEERARHEALMSRGRFHSSERGFDHFLIRPAQGGSAT